MKNRKIALLLAILVPSLAYAQGPTAYHCTYGDLVRRVEIVTEPGVSVPCEVHYHKDTEAPGERQVLWSASQDAAYCEQKTSEFIGKLLGWGWTCGQADEAPAEPAAPAEAEAPAEPEAPEAPAEPEAMPASDTDHLEPADPPRPEDDPAN